MCQVTSVDRLVTGANERLLPAAAQDMKPQPKSSGRSNGLRVLICSESVPPQVNGIARRIGMYADGLRNLGCDVGKCNMLDACTSHPHLNTQCSDSLSDVLHPDSGAMKVLSHVNPWNFTARMMIVHPYQLIELLTTNYDVVHIVMPANLSGMWILASYKILRCVKVRPASSLTVGVPLFTCNSSHHVYCRLLIFSPLNGTAPVKASPRGQLAL